MTVGSITKKIQGGRTPRGPSAKLWAVIYCSILKWAFREKDTKKCLLRLNKYPTKSFLTFLFHKLNFVFLAKILENISESLIQVFQRLIGRKRHPFIFDFTPQNFNEIQFRRISR